LAQVSRRLRGAAACDVPSFIPDSLLDVRNRSGFSRSSHGYSFVSGGCVENQKNLGCLAATDPWAFVRTWMLLPASVKSPSFRRQCVQDLALQEMAWHPEVVVSLRLLLPRSFRYRNRALEKRAVWYANLAALSFLLDRGEDAMHVDDENGALLRLALSTLGFEHPETTVVDVVRTLLDRGADPSRHDLWGIRLCLHMGFWELAALLCERAPPWLSSLGRQELKVLKDHAPIFFVFP
jgi:hypothetical protein